MATDETWTLWRQDDHGSTTVIARRLEKRDAEAQLAELEARGHKQHYWIEREPAERTTTLRLVVIRSKDPEAAKAFYEALGLHFSRHQHGGGDVHYAAESPKFVFEIYPLRGEASSGVRLGFSVQSVEGTVEALRTSGYEVIHEPMDSPWGRRAVVLDPDGHRVEIMPI